MSFVVCCPFFYKEPPEGIRKGKDDNEEGHIARGILFFVSGKQQTAQATTKGLSEKAGQPPLETTKGGGKEKKVDAQTPNQGENTLKKQRCRNLQHPDSVLG